MLSWEPGAEVIRGKSDLYTAMGRWDLMTRISRVGVCQARVVFIRHQTKEKTNQEELQYMGLSIKGWFLSSIPKHFATMCTNEYNPAVWVPWVRVVSQYLLQVVCEMDKVWQAFNMFPQGVRLSRGIALSSQLDRSHKWCHSLQYIDG